MNYKFFITGLTCAFLCQIGNAQTTLSGDHIITGDLDVGTTGTPGNLEVTGETGNSAFPGIKTTGDGGVLFMGTLGTGQIPAVGGGVRFMWYPRKGALRAGELSSNYNYYWEDGIVGIGSIAFSNSYAAGDYSVAFSGGEAEQACSTAMSEGYAFGNYSTAMSFGYAWGDNSTGMSGGSAEGLGSTGMSAGAAFGTSSTGMSGGVALALCATAMGGGSAERTYSTAMSGGNAKADYSTVAGNGAAAWSYNSFVVGQNNVKAGSENPTEWVSTDPLFVIGNGTGNLSDSSDVRNRNAFTVYKNGKIKMDRQGDILMGEFGNP